jgi:hypothetical protein
MEAISILGREVMQPRGLIGLGYDSIDFCGLEIAQVCNYKADILGFVYYPNFRPFESLHWQTATQSLFTVRKARIGLDCLSP